MFQPLSAFTSCLLLLIRIKLNTAPPLPSYRPVMEVPSDKPLLEEQARLYLRDIILGLEYCEWGAACPLEQGTGEGDTGRGGAQAQLALCSSCLSALISQLVSFGGVAGLWAGPSFSGGKGKGVVADVPGCLSVALW